MAGVLACLIYPQISAAEGFTGKTFKTWPQSSQDGYINASVVMTGVIAAQIQPGISDCVDRWYFAGPEVKTQRNASIRDAIAQYDTYHPSGVILALIQEECGAFE